MDGARARLPAGRFVPYAAVVLIFLLLDTDFQCTCKPQDFDCKSYLLLPVSIVFVFMLWTDGSFQRVCRHLSSSLCGGGGVLHACSFWASWSFSVGKAAVVALLWTVCVLVQGDWYVCCGNHGSPQQAALACKDRGSLTEQERVMVAELKNQSRIIGSFLLLGMVCVPALLSSFRWRKPSSCERQHFYRTLILEEEEDVLKEILRKHAREKLWEEMQNRIRGDQWEECFDVAEELVSASAGPAASG